MLATVLAVGFAAAGLAHVTRATAPTSWLLKKPLSCDLCMSFWGAFVGVGVLQHDLFRAGTIWSHDGVVAALVFLGHVLGAVAVSLLVLKTTERVGRDP